MIVRIKRKSHNYSIIDNAPLSDSRLSYRARGVLAYLLTKPDEWEVNMKEIESGGKEGREAIRAAFNELKALGYAELKAEKGRGGAFAGRKWMINECPDGKPEKPSFPQPDGKTESPKNRIPVPIVITDTTVITELEEEEEKAAAKIENVDPVELAIQALKADLERKEKARAAAPRRKLAEMVSENPAIRNTYIISRRLPPERFEEIVAAFDEEQAAAPTDHQGESQIVKHFLNFAKSKILIEKDELARQRTPRSSNGSVPPGPSVKNVPTYGP